MEFIKHLKIKNKLFILITAFSIGFILFGIVSTLTLNKTRINGTMYQEIILGKDLIADILPPPEYIIESYLNCLQILEESHFGKDGSSEKIQELIKSGELLKGDYELRHAYWLDALDEGKTKELMVENSYHYAEEFYEIRDTKFLPAISSNNISDINKYCQELKVSYENHRMIIDELVILTNTHNSSMEKKAHATISLSLVGLVAIVILLISIIGVLFYKISLFITRPLVYISDTMQKIARGDLSVRVDETFITKDEIGDLCRSVQATTQLLNKYLSYIHEITKVLDTISEGNLNFTLENDYYGEFSSIKKALTHISSSLSLTLENISQNSKKVSLNSQNISEGAVMLAQGAANQAAVIEEILSSTTEIASLVKNNSKDAKNAAVLSINCSNAAEQADTKMSELLVATQEINLASSEVSSVMETINDIAHKTNLLAFNASIEAARSGSSSAAFGIIASEIRDLSSQTSTATKLISKLIDNSVVAATHGSSLAADTADSLKNIINEFSHSAVLIDKIAKASNTQSETIQEISYAVEQIAKVVQENAAVSEESSSISDTLYAEAQELQQMISKFELCLS